MQSIHARPDQVEDLSECTYYLPRKGINKDTDVNSVIYVVRIARYSKYFRKGVTLIFSEGIFKYVVYKSLINCES